MRAYNADELVSFGYLPEAQRSAVADQLLAVKAIVEVPSMTNAQILGVIGH